MASRAYCVACKVPSEHPLPIFDEITRRVPALVAAAAAAGHRRALVLAGERPWCLQGAEAALGASGLGRVLWIGDRAPEGAWRLEGAKAHKVLGQEVGAAVFDAHAGFDPEAFGAVAGAVRGGGLLLLLTPPLDAWPAFDDPEHARIAVAPFRPAEVTGRFLGRLAALVRDAEGVAVMEQGGAVREGRRGEGAAPTTVCGEVGPPGDPACRTTDQERAVAAIMKVATGHRRRPLVLTSDRGRGKSAALGIAAARLLQRGLHRILVTAPRLDAVEPVFEHARRLLPGADSARGRLRMGEQRIEFAPPDALCLTPQPADLLLVDEAAAIPAPLLERLLQHHARVVFATTIHGYEGTGRGFAVRFRQVLEQRTPDWKALRLETPVRWAGGDPVERFAFRALLLDASPAPDEAVAGASAAGCAFERLDRDALAEDEATLSELFGLLVLAHYRTSPGDLRHLLDGPNLAVYVMRHAGHVAATALVAAEGGFDPATARAIWEGRRRPRGHLIPQSLAAHAGLEEAPPLSCARIMRIAVHPALRRRGLGTRLVGAIVGQARADRVDYVGSSFGATAGLLRFWARSGFEPARLGLTRGAASGAHSVIVLHPLSAAGEAVFAAARSRFLAQLPRMLSEPYRDLEPALAAVLLRNAGGGPVLDAWDWRNAAAFAFALRGYEVTLVPIWKLTCAALADPAWADRLTGAERGLLIMKVLQGRNWGEVAAALGVPGRAQAIEALRRALRPLILQGCDEVLRREIRRMAGPSGARERE